MQRKKTFEGIVRAMTSYQIIMAMVNGLKAPCVKVDMMTFGKAVFPDDEDQSAVCHGCAATNTICEISGHAFTTAEVSNRHGRAIAVKSNYTFLDTFENAIDSLRKGYIEQYNKMAEEGKFAKIEYPAGVDQDNLNSIANFEDKFPKLCNDYRTGELNAYVDLAQAQSSAPPYLKQKFEDIVRSMTAKEIVYAMVKGLENPCVEIDMWFYGKVQNETCYGCAATTTICQISGYQFTQDDIALTEKRARAVNSDWYFLKKFEEAIDLLRRGCVNGYNEIGSPIGLPTIVKPEDLDLPELKSSNYSDNLGPYRQLAKAQKGKKRGKQSNQQTENI